MKKSFFVVVMISLMLSFMLISCGKKAEVEKKEDSVKAYKISLVTDVGGVNDQSFNQSAWEGLSRAKKDLGIDVSYIESKQDADYMPNLETLYDSNNDLIWGIGFKMADRVLEAAKQNPEQKYAIIDYSYGDKTPANTIGVLFKEQEASFLVGYIAGKMSKTGKIGFVGGMDVPVIHRFQYGFDAGVLFANPKTKIFEQYAESFTNAATGKAIANQMYKNGADIVFQAAGGAGDGVIEAAKEKNLWAIGVDRDQSDLAPKNVLTSAMKRVDNAIYDVSKKLKNGNFDGGKTLTYSLKDGGVDIAPTTKNHVPQSILDEVAKIKEQIISGKITTPSSKAEFIEWKKANIK